MLSYRHGFHAGNFADVFKHTVLVALLRALACKDAGFTVLDTHAGAGGYDLAGPQAARTGEHRDGIGRLWSQHPDEPALADYLDRIRACNGDGELAHYPGSPFLVAELLRPQDRLIACELHPADHAALRAVLGRRAGVAVHRRDGFEALGALLPPTPRRGLVFMDPPYELARDWDRVVDGVAMVHRRWPQGLVSVWYPLIGHERAARLRRRIRELALPATLDMELAVAATDAPIGMHGCGMLVLNAPWQFDAAIRPALAMLARELAQGADARHEIRWLVPS